jgi:hypothetical protein
LQEEHERAEREELIERYRLLTKATSDAVYDYDYRTGCLAWNEGLEKYGYSPEEVEPTLEWWEARIHDEERETVTRALQSTMTGVGGPFETAYRFRCRDGSYRYVVDRGYVLKDARGEPVRMVGAMRDAHIYGQMFAASPQPMWAFHRETLEFLEVNEAAIQLYGYSREEFLNMRLVDIRPPEDVPMLIAAVRSVDRDHEGRSIWRHFAKDGRLLYVEVRTSDFDHEGKPARLSQITDVTRRVVLEEQLRETQKMDAIAVLAGGVAHDFNNLLTVVNGYAESVMRRMSESDPSRREMEAIAQAGERAAGLTRQLLAFARKQLPEPQLVQLNEVVRGVQPLLEKMLEPRVRLDLVLREPLRVLKADPGQLEQVLLNLVGNARDAIEGEGWIRLTTVNVEVTEQHPDYRPGRPVGWHVLLSVEDNGCGMSDEVRRRVFEPFFTTKEAGKGTGLGLPTVYGIVRQHGGWIAVESAVGRGSAFRIYLPEVPFASGEVAEQPPAPSKKVLLVQADDAAAERVKASLDSAGYAVRRLRTGAEARLLSRGDYGVILCDAPSAAAIAALSRADGDLRVLYLDDGSVQAEADLCRAVEELIEGRRKGNDILLVEDEVEIRRYLKGALEEAGFAVVEAAHGLEALAWLAQREFALMVTDLVMPEHEGLETIQRVKKEYPMLPVIAMSGAFAGQFLTLAKMFGAEGVLAKPLNGARLVAEVRRVLGA